MARAEVGAQKPSLAGVAPTEHPVVIANGIKFRNNGTEWLLIDNQAGAPLTVTALVPASRTVYGQTVPNKTWVVADGEKSMIGPFPPELFRRSAGEVGGDAFYTYVDFNDDTNVYVTVISGL